MRLGFRTLEWPAEAPHQPQLRRRPADGGPQGQFTVSRRIRIDRCPRNARCRSATWWLEPWEAPYKFAFAARLFFEATMLLW